MAVMAVEAVPIAAEAAPATAAAGGGRAAAAGALPVPGGSGGGTEEDTDNHGVLLGVGIILLWLAGVAFFIALEGIQVEQGDTTGGGIFRSILGTLVTKAQDQEQKGG